MTDLVFPLPNSLCQKSTSFCQWWNRKQAREEEVKHCEPGRSFSQVEKHTMIPNQKEIVSSDRNLPKIPDFIQAEKTKNKAVTCHGSTFHSTTPTKRAASDFRGLSLRQNNTKRVKQSQMPTVSVAFILRCWKHQPELLQLNTFHTVNSIPATGTQKKINYVQGAKLQNYWTYHIKQNWKPISPPLRKLPTVANCRPSICLPHSPTEITESQRLIRLRTKFKMQITI